MKKRKNRIPTEPALFMAFLIHFRKIVNLKTTVIAPALVAKWTHIRVEDLLRLGEIADMMEALYALFTAANPTENDKRDFRAKRDKVAIPFLNKFINSYIHHMAVSPEEVEECGLVPHSTTKTRAKTATIAPLLNSVIRLAKGVMRLIITTPEKTPDDEGDETRVYINVFLRVLHGKDPLYATDVPITDARELKFFQRFRGKKIDIKLPGESGKTVYLAFQYENDKAEPGIIGGVEEQVMA